MQAVDKYVDSVDDILTFLLNDFTQKLFKDDLGRKK